MLVEDVAGGFRFTYLSEPNQLKLYHKPNGPAKEWDDGDWGWWLYGRAHRYYGQAFNNGAWINHGEHIKCLKE